MRLNHTAQNPGRPSSAQRVGGGDAVSPGQGGGQQGHHLVARIGSSRRMVQVEVPVNQWRQAKMQAQRGRKEQPSIGHQAVVIKGDLDPVGVLLILGTVCCYKTIIPEAQEHFLTPSARRDTHLFGGLGLSVRSCPPTGIDPQAANSPFISMSPQHHILLGRRDL